MQNFSGKIIKELLDNEKFIQWVLRPTPELNHYWEQQTNNNEELRTNIGTLKNILEKFEVKEPSLSNNDKQIIWKNIEAGINKQEQKQKKLRKLFISAGSVAATILLVAGGWWYFTYQLTNVNEVDYSAYNAIDESMLKSGNINLVLSDEKVIDIEKDSVTIAYDSKGSININSEKIAETKPEATTVQMNQLIVPYGKSSSIILSDGTKIWVNSGSKLVYPTVFERNKREIFLSGEAYMDVTRNENAPFIIKTNHLDVNVLGTILNVSAYGDDDVQSVVLVTGAVEVKSKELKGTFKIYPEQMLSYATPSNDVNVQVVDVERYTSWVNGYLLTERESLNNVFQKLERHYNLKFNFDRNEFRHKTVSGKLDLISIEEVLERISITVPLIYKVADDHVDVQLKKDVSIK